MKEMISVVIPCFEDGGFLDEAIESVGVEAVQIIVVDDGSEAADTISALERVASHGISVVRQPHRGLSAARNEGFRRARTPYVMCLDADNRLRPGFLDHACSVLDGDPRVGAVYGDIELFGASRGHRRQGPSDPARLVARNLIDANAVLRHEMWHECGGYDETLAGWEDWDLWLGAVERGWRLERVPVVAVDYRVRSDGLNARLMSDRALGEEIVARVIAKHVDLYAHHLRHVPRRWERSLAAATADREAMAPGAVDPVVMAALGVPRPAVRRTRLVELRGKWLRVLWFLTDARRRASTAVGHRRQT